MPATAAEADPHAAATDDGLLAWERDGFLVVRGLWTWEEIDACREHFDALAERVPDRPPPVGADGAPADPLERFPRLLHPHRSDALSRRMLLDPRVEAVLRRLLGEEPIATQSMFYFKPPGSRGQALHQDNYYLKVAPRTCVAAWTAVDAASAANGGLLVCPRTQGLEVRCPELADAAESFTSDLVRPPAGVEPVAVELEPGDVLFFNGSLVHGSGPNATADRWRRSFICHYAPASAEEIASNYRPCLRFDGSEHAGIAEATGGGPCGEAFTGAAAAAVH